MTSNCVEVPLCFVFYIFLLWTMKPWKGSSKPFRSQFEQILIYHKIILILILLKGQYRLLWNHLCSWGTYVCGFCRLSLYVTFISPWTYIQAYIYTGNGQIILGELNEWCIIFPFAVIAKTFEYFIIFWISHFCMTPHMCM